MKTEFDHYIKDYRKNLDDALALSGESSIFFADYKALKLKEWLPERANIPQAILDFGCGDGVMTSFVRIHFPHATLYGVDPSSKSIQSAQKSFPTMNFSVNYDEKPDLDFPDHSFDIIFAAGAFHHIPFEKHQGYLQEISRILKRDGVFVMFELNPFNPLTTRTFKRNPIDYNACMLKPAYAQKICHTSFQGKKSSLKFYCFFPRAFKILRPLETYLTKLPLGALYAVVIT